MTRFGAIYFHHLQDQDYFGPQLASQVGASFLQIDTSDVSLWHQIHRGPDSFDWSLLDQAYDLCQTYQLEPVPSLSHHFAPPSWITNGPFNDGKIATPQYSKFGERFSQLTVLEKAFGEFVEALIDRYGTRTQLYVLSHEWNLTQEMFRRPDQSQNDTLVRNQLGCTMLAYKIIKHRDPDARLAYGLLNLYRMDLKSNKRISGYTDMIEAWPFAPEYMIQQYVETGDKDFLDILATAYVFHLGHSDTPTGFGTIYLDNSVGTALEAFWNTEVEIAGQLYRYRDYIKEIIVSPFSYSTHWMANPNRDYSESEQSAFLENSVAKIEELAGRGIPITHLVVTLNDKNEDWTTFAPERWIFVPEGMYKIKGFTDPLAHRPTEGPVTYEPKQIAGTFEKLAGKKS